MRPLLAAIPLIGVWMFSPTIAQADNCRLSQMSSATVNRTYTLPTTTRAWGESWGNTSIRRTKSDLAGQPFDHNLRRVDIVAIDSAVAFYAYTGDEFDGRVHASYCPKGQTCTVTWSGQVGMDSFICQREFADKGNNGGIIGNPSLPLEGAVAPFGDEFSQQVRPSVDAFVDLDTAIRWTTSVTTQRILGGPLRWSNRYRDDLIFFKKFIMSTYGQTHVVDVSIFMRPTLVDDRLRFEWRGHDVSVSSGALAGLVHDNIHARINGVLLGTELEQNVRIEAGRQYCQTGLCGSNPSDIRLEDEGGKFTDFKRRLQLSFVAHLRQATGRSFLSWTDTRSHAPTIVLNQDR